MLPKISILIPTLNEENFIEDCVESLLCDSYPIGQIEVLIIDGGSSDRTLEKVKNLQRRFEQIQCFTNPLKIVPSALNIGIQQASNPIIVWCGSHALYGKDYLKNSVNTLLSNPNCASAGGVITPIAKTSTGKAIAIATSHKFGIGNALYRYATGRAEVDTVFGGCFYKSSVITIGGFNEEWVRNQDYEFNFRLRKMVGKVILDPSIQCQYYCRESITKLSRQYYSYGFWRFRTLLKHPQSLTLRQTAPILLINGLISSLVALICGYQIGFLLPFVYGLANIIVSLFISFKQKQAMLLLRLPLIFATIHLSWGAGFMISAIKIGYNKMVKLINQS